MDVLMLRRELDRCKASLSAFAFLSDVGSSYVGLCNCQVDHQCKDRDEKEGTGADCPQIEPTASTS